MRMAADHVHETAYAKRRGDRVVDALLSVRPGILAGVLVALLLNARPAAALELATSGAAIAALLVFLRPRAIDCSICDTTLAAPAGRCPGCAAAIRGRR